MNNEEAIENLIAMEKEMRNGYGNAIVNVTLEDLCCAISALKNQQKYRWHDLRKNPNDLPNSWSEILCLTYRSDYILTEFTGTQFVTLGCDGYDITNHIIAWREIEPFEEK